MQWPTGEKLVATVKATIAAIAGVLIDQGVLGGALADLVQTVLRLFGL